MEGRLPCLKLLIQAGADINFISNSGLNAISAHLVAESDEEVLMLLYAAGTKIDEIPSVPDCLQDHLELRHICRKTVRNHLLKLDSHSHLFGRVPHLGEKSFKYGQR